MVCRHMYITLHENGDVEYDYFRHHSRYKLSYYLIECPAEKVIIHGGQELETDNFCHSVTKEGYLLLSWDKRKEDIGRGFHYTKMAS